MRRRDGGLKGGAVAPLPPDFLGGFKLTTLPVAGQCPDLMNLTRFAMKPPLVVGLETRGKGGRKPPFPDRPPTSRQARMGIYEAAEQKGFSVHIANLLAIALMSSIEL